MQYISTPTSIVFFANNRPVRFDRNSEKYTQAVAIFDLPKEEQDAALDVLINGLQSPNSKAEAVDAGFVIDGAKVSYQGEELPKVLADKVLALIEQGLPIDLFLKFWENLRLNPSYTSIRELYDFLAYKELPLTEDGCFLAYKGVQRDFYSKQGNTETKVIRGTVDENGKIYNGVGEIIEVDRQHVCDDRSVHCAPGVHVGSLEYARDWAPIVVVVKVNPRDVVSVPSDYSCQKCRCSQYEVVSSFTQEIVAPVVDSDLKPVVNQEFAEQKQAYEENVKAAKENYDDITNRVQLYIRRRLNADADCDFITVRQIQNSFSPQYPSKERILDALTTLGYVFFQNGTSYYVNVQ
jgi:hypothetical protein